MANPLSVGDIKQYVRDYLDADATDLPDSFFNIWIPESYSFMVDEDESWPWFSEIVPNWQTTPGQNTYDSPLSVVESIEFSMWQLRYLDQNQAERLFPPSWVGSGQPQAFSFPTGSTIRIWPPPTAIFDLSVRGFRAPADFLKGGDGAIPDCPDEWHPVLAKGVLAQAIAQQGDLETYAAMQKEFEVKTAELKSREIRAPRPGLKVLNGGPRYITAPPTLRFPFDPIPNY